MTITDIARASGYSVSTVSRVLNDHPDVSAEARQKIRALVEENGFVPNANARQLKVESNKSIAIIVKGAFNTFFAGILEQMQARISEWGYVVEVQYIDEDADEVAVSVQLQREHKPLGIIYLGGVVQDFEHHFSELGLPAVLSTTVSRELDFPTLSQVGVDDAAAGADACRLLVRRGHRLIGVIGGNTQNSYISRMRYEGFCGAYAETVHAPHPETLYRQSNFSMAGGYHAMQKLLAAEPGLSAVFCMSDLIAVGAMRAVHDAGLRVPQDISVVGFDGVDICRFTTPSLCSIRQPQRGIADSSVELLLDQIERHAPARTLLLETELLAGESVGPAPQP